MTDQHHPHYGNGIKALQECERLGNQLLETLPALQTWKTAYEANRQEVWIQTMLEKGTAIVKEYKEHSIYRPPVAPVDTDTDTDTWSVVEATYNGNLDVSLTAAAQQAYQAALRLPNVPHHEGECYGGFICILCDDDEWRWSKQVLEEADMPNNIFWNPRLQAQFVEEMRHVPLAIPATWTSSASNRPLKPLDIDKGTPFQCVRSLVEHVWLRWSTHVGVRHSDYEVFKALVSGLPGLEADVLECLGKLGELRDMY